MNIKEITTIREAYLQVCEINNSFDAMRFVNRMMDAIKLGLFFDEASQAHFHQVIEQYDHICKIKGIEIGGK